MFENAEIPVDALPSADDLDWQPLDPSYVRCLRIQHALFALIPFVPLAIVSVALPFILGWLSIGWAASIGVAVLLLVWPGIAVPRCGYVVRDHDIVFRSGVIWRSVTAIPYNRIQHVETSSTPFDRRFGLATLQLFTAGGSGGDLKIGGLPADVAERLRIHVLRKAGASIEYA